MIALIAGDVNLIPLFFMSPVMPSDDVFIKLFTCIVRFNPDNLPRTRADLHKDAVNLDHIIPIIYGFKNGIASEIIADARNLRILPARKNLSKKQKLTEEGEILLKELLSIK